MPVRCDSETGMRGAFFPQAHVFTRQTRNNCLTEKLLITAVFWDITPSTSVETHTTFRSNISFAFSGRKCKQREWATALLAACFCCFLAWLFIYLFLGGGLRLSALGTSATIWPIVPVPDDDGAVGRMRTDRGNRSIRTKSAPVPLRPPQFPHDLTRVWTRTIAVESQRLSAWATARLRWNLLKRGLCTRSHHYKYVRHFKCTSFQ
jgi:hypothetical protein